MNRGKCIPLMDNGHYYPTEVVSDKIPALLSFFPEIALHITRPVRWDSDHVVRFDDETKELCKEIVRIAEAEAKAHEIINAAEVQRQAILADADREAKRRIELFNQQFKEFLNTHT